MGLPTGEGVAFLFTDVEGATRLELAVGTPAWAPLIARHDALVRDAVEAAGGQVVKGEGDALFAAFAGAPAAVAAAVAAQRAIAAEPWPEAAPIRVRMGIHIGEGRLRERAGPTEPEDYVGIDVNYAARIAAAGNGGQIVVSDAVAAGLGGLGAGVSLVDEGRRRLKDFDEPRSLHRVVVVGAADDARPLRTLDAPSNLPEAATALVGRATEIATVVELLGRSRIVTLVGPGGTGKTRLALAAAASLRPSFPDGTWFVDLAPVQDAGLLPGAIATILAVGDAPDRPIDDVLRDHLRSRRLLLVLDNLEQLLPDAAGRVAELVRTAPEVRVLVTSRELLRISGEQAFGVPPLDPVAAFELLLDRARLQRPDFRPGEADVAALRQICARLDGLPLALELAAARLRLFNPAAVLERLGRSLDLSTVARDLPERQRTLRGAIAWSHDLLPDPERALFRRLAVFLGGWTAAAALDVVDPDGALAVDLEAGLESLADKSLIRIEPTEHGEPRFSRHTLIREFALEQLAAAGEQALCEARHAGVFVALAEHAGPELTRADSLRWLDILDHEQHNLRAAIDWSLATGEPACGLRIVGSIWRWWQIRGRLREGRQACAALLAHPAAQADGLDPRIRIAGLVGEGGLAYWLEDFDAARAAYDERLALAEATGEPALIAEAHYDRGFLDLVAQDHEGLRRHESLALELFDQIGDAEGSLKARQALVLVHFLLGELATARDLERRNLEAFRATGSPYRISDSSTLLAGISLLLGEPDEAEALYRGSFPLDLESGNPSGLVASIGGFALLRLQTGEPEVAARLAGASRRIARETETTNAATSVLHFPDPVEAMIEALGEDRAEALMAEGEALSLEEVARLVLGDAARDLPASSLATGARRPTG